MRKKTKKEYDGTLPELLSELIEQRGNRGVAVQTLEHELPTYGASAGSVSGVTSFLKNIGCIRKAKKNGKVHCFFVRPYDPIEDRDSYNAHHKKIDKNFRPARVQLATIYDDGMIAIGGIELSAEKFRMIHNAIQVLSN